MKTKPSFIELSDYWLSITREDYALRGYGKWILYTDTPHKLFGFLKEEMFKGGLADAFSIKTLAEPKKEAYGEVSFTPRRIPIVRKCSGLRFSSRS